MREKSSEVLPYRGKKAYSVQGRYGKKFLDDHAANIETIEEKSVEEIL